MKINIKLTHLFWIALSIVVLSSCNYLDVVPPETAGFKDVMKDKEAALGFLYSCYVGIPSEFADETRHYYQAADEYALPPLWDYCCQTAAWNQLSATNLGDPTCPWINCYNNIGQCHLFIKALNELSPVGTTDGDKTRWRAEIKFLQAYYHFILLNAYGPIPLMTHYYSQTTPTSDFPGRSPYDVCVDSISAWLDEAAKNLPATVQEDELGRATSTACKALKARVLLYAASPLWNGSFPYPDWKNKDGQQLVSNKYNASKWQKALDACNDAISFATTQGNRALFDLTTSEQIRNSEGVPLPTISNTDDNFKKRVMLMRYLMTTDETEGNKETIYGVIVSFDAGGAVRDMVPHDVTTYNGSPVGGWCGVSPYLYTMEHFYTSSGKLPENDPNFPSKSEWINSARLDNPDIINLNVNREPRYYAWLSFDGDEYSPFISDGSPLVVSMLSSNAQGYNPDRYNRDNNVTGFLCKKWVQPNIKWRSTDGGDNISLPPHPVIRLAELYLNRAECYAALGQTDKALADLNVIRERAGISDLTAADITSSMTLVNWVRSERFIELWGEGHRYFDLRRWMLAPQYLKAGAREGLNAMEKKDPSFAEFNQVVKVDQPFQWTDRMYLLPIKSSELYSNPQLVQAPGY
jgi:starch-binding outer membrane protein, SusD/RagB family